MSALSAAYSACTLPARAVFAVHPATPTYRTPTVSEARTIRRKLARQGRKILGTLHMLQTMQMACYPCAPVTRAKAREQATSAPPAPQCVNCAGSPFVCEHEIADEDDEGI